LKKKLALNGKGAVSGPTFAKTLSGRNGFHIQDFAKTVSYRFSGYTFF